MRIRLWLSCLPLFVLACGDSDPSEPMGSVTVVAVAGGIGGGVVTSDPAGISCTLAGAAANGACFAEFAEGTNVFLEVAASPGSRLREWSGACSGSGGCVLAPQGSMTVAASFERTAALIFDGTAQFVEIPDATALDLGSNWTIEAWVKRDVRGGQVQHLVSKWGVTGAASYSLELDGSSLELATSNGTDATTVITAVNRVSVGDWHHVAATFANGVGVLYVDGVEVANSAGMAIPMNSDKPLSIGREGPPFNGYYFSGSLDEVRIWQVTRTQEQVSNSRVSVLTMPQAGLVGYWRLDDGTGQVATDLSPSGVNGRLGVTMLADPSDPSWTIDTSPAN